jgi:hypothetical protein
MAVVDAGYETLTREALLARIDELSASLGYRSGEFLHAVQAGLGAWVSNARRALLSL